MTKHKKKKDIKYAIPESAKKNETRKKESDVNGQMLDSEVIKDNEANQEETLLSDYGLDEK